MKKSEKKNITWDDVIYEFFRKKRESEEEKYLKDELKAVGELYKKVNYLNDAGIEFLFDTKRNKKSDKESALSFQRRRAIKVLKIRNKVEGLDVDQKKEGYRKKVDGLREKFSPSKWLSENAGNAGSVNFATHVIKLTHSKIDTPSFLDCIDEKDDVYLTTSTLRIKQIDGAVTGNQFAPIFQFLELQLEGVKLAEHLLKDNRIFEKFLPFGESDETTEEMLKEWTKGFRKALGSGSPATHSLAKQVYFPVVCIQNHNNKYNHHLLCNVVSSSLAHAVYEKVFDENQKPVKNAREKGKFSPEKLISFIQRSALSVTASNHSNASQLNAKRGGKLHLFSTQPPTWQTQLKPPIYRKSLFDDFYNSAINTELDYLRDFLLRFKQLDLSIKDPRRMRHLERWVNNLIDEFLFYVSTMQNLQSGWSIQEGIRLKKEHQYLLDPYRMDEAFQLARQGGDWQAVIRADFALWLNRQVRGKDNQFTPQKEHTQLWKKLLETPLRELMEPIEIELKQQARGSL
ncbi:MAG: type I-F CRISPR-associated protein Csy1 [Bacteroidales bacterium]